MIDKMHNKAVKTAEKDLINCLECYGYTLDDIECIKYYKIESYCNKAKYLFDVFIKNEDSIKIGCYVTRERWHKFSSIDVIPKTYPRTYLKNE